MMGLTVLMTSIAVVLLVLHFHTSKRLKLANSELGKTVRERDTLTQRYAPIIDADSEVSRLSTEAATYGDQIARLKAEYKEKHDYYSALVKQIAVFDERLAFAEMGMYEPHFDFSDSEKYKIEIEAIRTSQKEMIKAKTAVSGNTSWTVDGSASKGQTMINRIIKLNLRAFNAECDAAISNARWNNVVAMEKRITKAFEQINALNQSNKVELSAAFLDLKLKELRLTHEQREQLKAEREQRTEAARAAREEQKLLRDMEKAEEEEAHYRKLLDKAKQEAANIVGPKLDTFRNQIDLLEKDLAAAHARFERAQAMAEKTRSGYVYIISNIGSFGPDMVKIGLTRRLDPSDRIRELGDASVPFVFDTHAVIYSDDAPRLEKALHAEFEATRVNTQNARKEFFRTTIDQVEQAVKRIAPDAAFFNDTEAQEYRETLAARDALLSPTRSSAMVFPSEI